ncbi:stalk domain-containing protein [Ammoniphilus sp. 3BR4]|uniref:stalk domain-containing protein n=1 Tax=Ammoniphilus sp. 3BR4 TaxID=3158265 RepID=UPI003465048B
MKKFFLTCMCALMVFIGQGTQYVQAQSPVISVYVDGLKVDFDVDPVIQNGRTLVPFRAIAEALGVDVSWDASSQTVKAVHQEKSIALQIGNATAMVNESQVRLEANPIIQQGRTMIPLRFFSENLSAEVKWEETTRTVRISSPPSDMNVMAFYALGDRDTSSWTNLFGAEYPNRETGYTDIVDELGLGWYSLDAGGTLVKNSPSGWKQPEGWESVLEAARESRMGTDMVVHLPDRSPTMMSILGDEKSTQQAIDNILEEAKEYFSGINLDIEGLGYNETPEQLLETKSRFNHFVRRLSEQARQQGLSITLTLHPPNSVYKGYDYSTLGEIADAIVIMAYDYHQDRARLPEPLHKVTEAVSMALENVPAEKLVLGISAYQENEQSIVEKIGVAKRYKLRGIALWRLGLITDKHGEALRQAIQ